MTDAMFQRGYATSTQANYVKAIYGMAKYYRRDPAQYNAEEVKPILLHMVKDRHVSFSSMNQTACAARFLYETVLGHDRETFRACQKYCWVERPPASCPPDVINRVKKCSAELLVNPIV
jgi:hypothetical protein